LEGVYANVYAKMPDASLGKSQKPLFLWCIFMLEEIGSGGRDRTYDQLINSQLLYR
jgi:hypothetical protein